MSRNLLALLPAARIAAIVALLAPRAAAQTTPAVNAAPASATPPAPEAVPAAPPPAPAIVSLSGPSLAATPPVLLRPAPPAVAEPEPEAEASHDHPLAFRAQFRLPFTVASLGTATGGGESSPFAPVPQLLLGFQIGRVGLGAGLGFTHFGSSDSGDIEGLGGGSLNELLIAPTLTVDAFESKDGKVALYVLGAPIFGIITESDTDPLSDLGFQFALGASYALHDNFRLGMEAGPVGHFYVAPTDTESTISIYTALVGTFVYPR